SFQVDLPRNLKQRGVHDVFHSSLLRIHEPNDDRLFPGRMETQVAEFEDSEDEWIITRILSHHGAREQAIFEALWRSGDRTWVPYREVRSTRAVAEYLEVLG
ncbi:uncharacterized protein TRAVEDRAFT_81497, partial [Trametes versicolor FP-101664 SS1]|uniref:uncharacterized protein n=1 Tax=Trametes versicolor (strain FP-101664) TaxID=717944 RepID=UPI0004624212